MLGMTADLGSKVKQGTKCLVPRMQRARPSVLCDCVYQTLTVISDFKVLYSHKQLALAAWVGRGSGSNDRGLS